MVTVKHSWVLPVYNEAQSLPQLLEEIKQVERSGSFEIIAVDDASTDESTRLLRELAKTTPQLKVLSLNSRQGKWAALLAGFKASNGEIVIILDSDLQDNPKEAGKLLSKLKQGYDLTSGWRKIRHDPPYKVLISNLGNFLVSALTKETFHDLNSPFKLYRKEVLESLPKQGSMLRFSMLFAERLGYKVAEVPINHRPRVYGQSKFGVIKYIRILYDLILIMLLFSGSGRLKKLKT